MAPEAPRPLGRGPRQRPSPSTGCSTFVAFKVQSPRSKVQSPRSKVQSPRSKVQGPKSKVQSPRSKVQGPKSKVQSPRSKVQGPKSKVQSPRSKVQGPKLGWGRSQAERGRLVRMPYSLHAGASDVGRGWIDVFNTGMIQNRRA